MLPRLFVLLFAGLLGLLALLNIENTPAGIVAHQAKLWADWSAHFIYAARFAFYPPHLWFSENPLLAGQPFNYPFLSSLISGTVMRLGLSNVDALRWPSAFFLALSVLSVHHLYSQISNSRWQALFATVLSFLGGGFGWWVFLNDYTTQTDFFSFYRSAGPSYAIDAQGIFAYGDVLSCFLLPQRAFPLGIALGAFALATFITTKPVSKWRLWIAAFCFGVLPVTHVHSFLAVGGALVVTVFIALMQRQDIKPKVLPLGGGALLALVLLATFHAKSGHGFIHWQWGWITLQKGGFIYFWLANWGMFLPILIAALLMFPAIRRQPLLISGIVLFMLCHLMRFQPWDWDNTKLLHWSYLFLCPTIVFHLAQVFTRPLFFKGVAAVIYLSLIFTGGVNLYLMLQPQKPSFVMFSAEEERLAEGLRKIIKPGERVLTAGRHNDWVAALAGGQLLRGYDGWLWSYGFDTTKVRADMKKIYSGGSEVWDLLAEHQVSYIVIDGQARGEWNANDEFFRTQFFLALAEPPVEVFDVRRLKNMR